jgi:hypothetical protein
LHFRYILFDVWKSHPERVAGLIFCDTRADAEAEQDKPNRLKLIEKTKQEGTHFLADAMIPRMFRYAI